MAMQWYYFNGSNSDPSVNKFAESDRLRQSAGRDRPRRQVPPPVQRRRPGHGHQHLLQEDPTARQVHGMVLPAGAAEALCRGLPDRPEVGARQPGMAEPEQLQQALCPGAGTIPTTIGICRNTPSCSTNCRRRSRNAISGKKTVQQALDDAADRHEKTLEAAGYEIKRGDSTPEVPDTVVAPVGKDARRAAVVRLMPDVGSTGRGTRPCSGSASAA